MVIQRPYPEPETLRSAVMKARFGLRRRLALLSMVEQAASSAQWTLEGLPAAVRVRSSIGSISMLALLSRVEQTASLAWWTLKELPAAVRVRSSMESFCISVTGASGTSTQAFG